MESPVRICLSAALVVLVLLLLSSTTVSGNALPLETTSTTVKIERNNRYARLNGTTWVPRTKPKNSDISLNELNPKESSSEENTDKNAKYKDRGRVKFNSQKTSTPRLRVKSTTTSTTEASKLENVIVITPTPEVKKPAQIIDDMKTYKKTKMPMAVSSSTIAPVSIKTETENIEEEEYEDEEEDKETFEKYTSNNFHDSNFFTIPSFNSDFNSNSENSDIKVKPDYSIPSFDTFSSLFPSKDASFEIKDDDEPYKSESFFNFELTTPKNDFFDKKFHKISSSILKNLASIKSKSPPSNATNVHKIVKEDVGLERLSNGSPNNKSTVIIKNTKEIRLLDNEEAGSANKALSDVHGTSIYYEMSVLSTETYAINHSSDDDCDNEKLPSEPTAGTSAEEEFASVKATIPTLFPFSTKPFLDKIPDPVPTLSTSFLPVSSSVPSLYNSIRPIPMSTQNNSLRPVPTSTQNSVSSTEKVSKVFSSNFSSRNRSYSKRLNLTGSKDSLNSVTSSTDQVSPNLSYRTPQRKFHYTTPKIKPIWMAPRRNVTRPTKPSLSSTIYSEHFNIKDKFSTTKQPNKTALTTVSSDIDPVLQSDISGVKKVVHSPTISDNSIPTLWKRGSTKFSTSTAASSEIETGVSDLEIPPTLTAWALASLRSPPALASPALNVTGSTQKSVDENELQKVGEIAEKQETTTGTTIVTTMNIPNDDLPKKVTDIDQNRLPWKPIPAPVTSSPDTTTEVTKTESKSERLPAESNISNVQSTVQVATTTESAKDATKIVYPSWIPVTTEVEITTNDVQEDKQYQKEITESSTSVNSTKPTFESITKLPSGITTPQDDTLDQDTDLNNKITTQVPATTDYEITTIRFSYVPTEKETEATGTESTTTTWHKIIPTRTKTTSTTLNDVPITTYRPNYMTTTEVVEDSTTIIPETSSLEVSSQVIESTTPSMELETTEMTVQTTTEEPTEAPTTKTMPVETTTVAEETTTITVEVVTEINTEREKPRTSTTESIKEIETTATGEIFTSPSGTYEMNTSSEENSDSNEVITQETTKMMPSSTTSIKPSTTEVSTTTVTEPTTVLEIRTTISHVQYGTTERITTQIIDESAKISEAETTTEEVDTTTDMTTKSVNELEDLTSYTEMTTEASSRVLTEQESGSGAAVAIAVSTIGVIALILLIGLLLVVRRRGRRGVYAQRCTPVSLDAYSLGSVSVGHRKGNQRLRASKRSYGNPAYDDEVTSHPMQYAALVNFAMDIDSIAAEFSEIPSVTVRPDEVPPGCEDKNRYSNVLPLPETRVPLSRIGNDPTTEYINANYITGPGNIRNYYIACQAPLPNTVVDFWRMIWEQNSRVIVMLTEYMENGVEKCYEYLPPSEVSDNKRTFGDFQIILKKREQRDKYAISSVQFINMKTRSWREVTHLWYFWPAKGVPDDHDSVIDFLSEMRSYMKISQTAKEYDEDGVEVIYGDQSRSSYSNLSKLRSDDSSSGNGVNVYSPSRAEEHMRRGLGTNGTLSRLQAETGAGGVRPCVVLCASGAGRTGALIALDVCARALAAASADVPRVVRELRAQRPHALANRNHYVFLYKVLSEYGNRLMGGGVDNI